MKQRKKPKKKIRKSLLKETKRPKNYWNHRILAFPDGKDTYFRVCEVFYTIGRPRIYSEQGAMVSGNSMLEMYDSLRKIAEAIVLPKPILWGGDQFPKLYKEPKTKKK